MATTRLMPLHKGKCRSVAKALGATLDYVKNPDKTAQSQWISAYQCNPSIAEQEFLFAKRQYSAITGREPKENDIIAYHLRQSFKPGEIDPATANKIGYDLAMSLTKGKHAFVVCTHVDKAHIHSHIVFNSTSLDCTRKFRNFWGSSFAIRRISDILCLENGLSVIEDPQPSKGNYGNWLGDEKQPPIRTKLEQMIDAAIGSSKDFNSFLAAMEAAGAEVKRGNHLAFRIPGGKRFIRCDSLRPEYSEDAIKGRILGIRAVYPKPRRPPVRNAPRLLIDIQARMKQARSPGFEHWAKIVNLKEMAKTLVYLEQKGLLEYDKLSYACETASSKFDIAAKEIKGIEARLSDISELQRHIGAYIKTHDTYAQYKKQPPRKQKKFYEQHRDEIDTCLTAKKYFNSLGMEKLPSMQSLRQEYAELLEKKRKLYPEMKSARAEMIDLMTAKNNVDRILGLQDRTVKHRSLER